MRLKFVILLSLIVVFSFMFISGNVFAQALCPSDWACLPDEITLEAIGSVDIPICDTYDGLVLRKETDLYNAVNVQSPFPFGHEPSIFMGCNIGSWRLNFDMFSTQTTHIGEANGGMAGFLKPAPGSYGSCRNTFKVNYDKTPKQEICNDNKDNDCDKKIDCADVQCSGKKCIQPSGNSGICMNSLCVRATSAELNIDEDYLNHLPIENKQGYKDKTLFKEKVIDFDPLPEYFDYANSLLVVTPYDELKCEASLSGYSYGKLNKEEISRIMSSDIQVNFEYSYYDDLRISFSEKCKPYDVDYISNIERNVFWYKCRNVNSLLRDDRGLRGTKQYCEARPKVFTGGLAYRGEKVKSNAIAVAKYIYYFVRVNQQKFDKDPWNNIRLQFMQFLNLKGNNANKNLANAVKPVYLDIDDLKYKKREFADYITEGFFDVENPSCKLKYSFPDEVYKKVNEKYGINLGENDRFVVVSTDIVNEILQCEANALDLLQKKFKRQGENIGAIPASIVYISALIITNKTEKTFDFVQEGEGQILCFPSKALKTIPWALSQVPVVGTCINVLIRTPAEFVVSLGQVFGTERSQISWHKRNKVVIKASESIGLPLTKKDIERVSELTLSKALTRSYANLCYEDSLFLYEREEKNLKTDNQSCVNEWPDCCMDEVGEKVLGSIKRLTVGVVGESMAIIPATGGEIAKILNKVSGGDLEEHEIWNSDGCGATFKCPGWPEKFDESLAIPGESFMFTKKLENKGLEEITYSISVKGYDSWAELDEIKPDSIKLKPGESEDYNIYFKVHDNDINGERNDSFIIVTKYNIAKTEEEIWITLGTPKVNPPKSIMGIYKDFKFAPITAGPLEEPEEYKGSTP